MAGASLPDYEILVYSPHPLSPPRFPLFFSLLPSRFLGTFYQRLFSFFREQAKAILSSPADFVSRTGEAAVGKFFPPLVHVRKVLVSVRAGTVEYKAP